ncbi:cytochrome c oxidase assembly protein [Haliea sp. E1-2-M8]|uniref:cytochrome c oxidase assembly protein n=1 Tax=Haliea sp. E1-2-M8 TaxID=3064706 RepID=UPI00272692A3|nr:cytochrome c oxidase assembly protein [Haliea sp. E1-2-M8]MDO8863430.1 cytochrome c oxidase assembly protein [Haliea sp. E1-2-M8]
MSVAFLPFLLGYSPVAFPHNPLASGDQEQLAALVGVLLLALFWLFYKVGSRRKPPQRHRDLYFHAATALCLVAVLGPLDELAETSAAAHMVQHMLFMVVVAPLWALAHPLPQIAAGGGRFLSLIWQPMFRLTLHPVLAAWLHGAVIWFWHMPVFYLLALENPWWHLIEHACFIISAGLFWWAVLNSTHRNAPWALLALLLTLMHTGFLGAILTFARAPLYGEGRELEDQQLAGLIMWVAGAIPYLMASVGIGSVWYRKIP